MPYEQDGSAGEAFDAEYQSGGGAPEGEEAANAEPKAGGADDALAEGEGASGSDSNDTDRNDPNSEYWKDQASSQGWVEGHDPGPGKFQKSAREFVNDGNFMSQISNIKRNQQNMEANFNERLETSLGMQKAAHQGRISELERQRDEAIEIADKPAANAIQEKIDKAHEEVRTLDGSTRPARPVIDPVVAEFNERNMSWLNDTRDPMAPNYAKAKYAEQVYNQAVANGTHPADAVRRVEEGISQNFPATNPRRSNAPPSESGGRPSGGRNSNRALTMNDLKPAELKQVEKALEFGMMTEKVALERIKGYRDEVK